jgi:hypothetical protein
MPPSTNGQSTMPGINGTSSPTTVQLIDENCKFKYVCDEEEVFNGSEDVGQFIRGSKLEGFGYHLVAVFGSQSTGKSSSVGWK